MTERSRQLPLVEALPAQAPKATIDTSLLDAQIERDFDALDGELYDSAKRAMHLESYEANLAMRTAIVTGTTTEPEVSQVQLPTTTTDSRPQTVGPKITGYGSMDKFGRFGKSIHTRRNTKR